jgi:chromosomal replication initiator protein
MKAWEEFLDIQEKVLGRETIHKWLRPLKVVRFDACNLYLEAKDSFQTIWFEEHIRPKVLTQLVNNNNHPIKVHLNAPHKATEPEKKRTVKGKKGLKPESNPFQLHFDELNPLFTFDQLVSSDQNLVPIKILKELKSDTPLYNPIYLYGSSGTGKTHLLTAAAHLLRSHGLNVLFARAETFTEHVISAIRAGEMSRFRQAYTDVDVLILDDVHVFSKKNATQEEFFHRFNSLHLNGKQIILAANCSPAKLTHVEPRLISRFEWGITLPLEPPQEEEKSKILLKKAEALHYPLHNKVADFLLETFKSNTKALIRALEALILRSHLNQESLGLKPMTASIAKHTLNDLILEEQSAALTPQKILAHVADHFTIRLEDIQGKSQTHDSVLPRQIAMHLCRHELKLPFTKIGELFSRDHSTVMSSVKLIQKALDERHKEIAGNYSQILQKMRG